MNSNINRSFAAALLTLTIFACSVFAAEESLALKQAYFFSCKNLLRFCRIGRCRNLCLHTRNKFFEALGRSSPVWFLCHSDFA